MNIQEMVAHLGLGGQRNVSRVKFRVSFNAPESRSEQWGTRHFRFLEVAEKNARGHLPNGRAERRRNRRISDRLADILGNAIARGDGCPTLQDALGAGRLFSVTLSVRDNLSADQGKRQAATRAAFEHGLPRLRRRLQHHSIPAIFWWDIDERGRYHLHGIAASADPFAVPRAWCNIRGFPGRPPVMNGQSPVQHTDKRTSDSSRKSQLPLDARTLRFRLCHHLSRDGALAAKRLGSFADRAVCITGEFEHLWPATLAVFNAERLNERRASNKPMRGVCIRCRRRRNRCGATGSAACRQASYRTRRRTREHKRLGFCPSCGTKPLRRIGAKTCGGSRCKSRMRRRPAAAPPPCSSSPGRSRRTPAPQATPS